MAPFTMDSKESSLRYRSRVSSLPSFSRNLLLSNGNSCEQNTDDALSIKSYIVVIIYFIVLVCVAVYVHGREPYALKLADEKDHRGSFIEERARTHLKMLTSFGPRPTGSYENEVLAVEYILRQVDFIKHRLKPPHSIQVDVQKPSGSFNLDFQDGFTSSYSRVQNIIVKFEPKTGANYSVMVNCHFDSVPGSPGASDDAVSCAVMLEVLYLFSQADAPFQHAVIFSFNGAEENLLQASHGFITQHKWSSKIKAFINLDSCGSGGRELLFQAGPENPWLIELYGRGAKYPFACILAQELFQSGIVPGDTDFRIFRDYGNIPGLDIAYIRNGYLYHTKYDREEYIPPGSFQRAGENLKGLLTELAMSPLVPDPGSEKHGDVIFFDFFGVFLVMYSEFIGKIVVYFSIVFCIYRNVRGCFSCRQIGLKSGSDYLRVVAKGVFLIFVSWIASLLGILIIALILDFLNASMSWYSNQILAFGLFLIPSVLIMTSLHIYSHKYLYKNIENLWTAEQLSHESHHLVWLLITIALYLANIKSSMVLIIGCLFPSVFRFLGKHLIYSRSRSHVRDFLVVNLAAWALPIELSCQAAVVAMQILIPVMGRSGASIQPDIFIGVVMWVTTIMTYNLIISFVHASRNVRVLLWCLLSVFVASFLVAVFTPLGHPYSEDVTQPAPQRFLISHVQRTFHDNSGDIIKEDSGIWVLPGDHNAAKDMMKYYPDLSRGHSVDDSCGQELMCGMPFYYPALRLLRKSVYVRGPKPRFHLPAKLKLISQSALDAETRRLIFNVTGPSHMAIYMSTETGTELVKWSFANEEPLHTVSWDGKPTYFIYHSYGEIADPWTFWFDVKIPINHSKEKKIINIALVAHYLHGHDAVTPELKDIDAAFPKWTYSMMWPSSYESWEF